MQALFSKRRRFNVAKKRNERSNDLLRRALAMLLAFICSVCILPGPALVYAVGETAAQETREGLSGLKSLSKKEITVPQKTYSVSKAIKSFDLNAKGRGKLSYSSSDKSVATVSSSGTVEIKKNGTADITISNGVSQKKVKVKVSDYKSANGKFMEAIGDIDSKSGDSSGREIRVKDYPGYKKSDHSRSWGFIVRCNDPEIADKAALAVSYIAGNDCFGYSSWEPKSQKAVNKRASIYKAVVKATGKKPSEDDLKKIESIETKADASCTPTILTGYWLYYDMSDKLALKWISPYNKKAYDYYCGSVNVEYHQLEKAIKHVNKIYTKKGMIEPFTIIYISEDERSDFFNESNLEKNLKRGDIICSCSDPKDSGHTGLIM